MRAVGDEQHGETRKVLHQRVAARRQKELLRAMTFKECDWHTVDDVDFDDAEAEIQKIFMKVEPLS